VSHRLAIVGLGKIAHDQHLPAIAASPDFDLVAIATRAMETVNGLPVFPDTDALLASGVDVDAVAMCQPPQPRFAAAAAALRAGKHVLLEKPPGATLAEVEALSRLAEEHRVTLFAAWHSRHAPAVEPARAWLADRTVRSATITWKEDVRRWHPGQRWIWEAGGLGVFDPGINALSIATRILPMPVRLTDARLEVPENCATPIRAQLALEGLNGEPVTAEFDFLQTGPQTWDIAVETDGGTLRLSLGGARMFVDDAERDVGPEREYPNAYATFARLIAEGRSNADVAPLRLVADAYLRGSTVRVEPFIE
jgi:D-galactose 1-dehydrogenase